MKLKIFDAFTNIILFIIVLLLCCITFNSIAQPSVHFISIQEAVINSGSQYNIGKVNKTIYLSVEEYFGNVTYIFANDGDYLCDVVITTPTTVFDDVDIYNYYCRNYTQSDENHWIYKFNTDIHRITRFETDEDVYYVNQLYLESVASETQ